MKNKTTKRALLMSVLSMLLCVSMLVGSTFAWFTDSVTSGNNKIVAGNLSVDLIHVGGGVDGKDVSIKGNPDHLIFDYDKWEPGYTALATLKVENKGTLALKYRLFVLIKGADEATNDKGETTTLADVIDVYAYYGSDGDGYAKPASFADITAEGSGWQKAGTLASFMADPDKTMIGGKLLPAGKEAKQADEAVGSVQMTVALHMQELAGNEYQGLSLGDMNFFLSAAQYTYEEDSFDENYDEGAKYPSAIPPVTTSKELLEALENAEPGDEIVLSEGPFEMPEEYVVAEGVTITGTPGTVLNVSGGKKDITKPNPETGITQGLLLNHDNITISGVTITGDVQNATGDEYTGYNALVRITGNNVTLDNVTIDSDTNDSPIVIASTKSDDNTITIKNCNLTAAFKAIHIVDGTRGTVNIENCNIDAMYTFNSNTNSVYKLSVKNSVLNGWTSYGTSVTSVEFDKCVFGTGHGQKTLAAYTDTVFNNCSFSDTQILAIRDKPGFKIEFNNCDYNKTNVTPDNIKTTITSDSDIWNYSTCFVNGIEIAKD